MGSLYIYIQVTTMQYILSILVCIYTTGHTVTSRTSRQAPSCSSSLCLDCLDSWDGGTKCPLCSLVTSACEEGKQLTFKGSDVCSKCKYCTGGKEECAKKCKLGKSSSTCQHCINNCGVRR